MLCVSLQNGDIFEVMFSSVVLFIIISSILSFHEPQGPLIFTVELHSQLHDDVHCETLSVDVGHPLVAALDLQRPTCDAHNSGTNSSSRSVAEVLMSSSTVSEASISPEINRKKCTSCMKCSAKASSLPAVLVSTLPAVPTPKSSPKFASQPQSQCNS